MNKEAIAEVFAKAIYNCSLDKVYLLDVDGGALCRKYAHQIAQLDQPKGDEKGLLTPEEMIIIIRQHNEARVKPSRTEIAIRDAQLAKLQPMTDEQARSKITDTIDNLMADLTILLLGGDKERVESLKEWSAEKVELNFQNREKAITQILALTRQEFAKGADCPTCEGSGEWGGPGINDRCGDCNGTGKKPKGDEKVLTEFIRNYRCEECSTPGFVHLVIPVKVASKYGGK